MQQRSMITNSEYSSLLHISQQNVSNYVIYALEQEAALHAFFRIVESWLFRQFGLAGRCNTFLLGRECEARSNKSQL